MRLFLADDHSIVRAGLRAILADEPSIELVGEEADGHAALAAILRLAPEVAILDIEMPGLTGLELARTLAEARAPIAVILLSMHATPALVHAAVDAGVAGYVLKDDAARELPLALAALRRGEVFTSPKVSACLMQALREPASGALTVRERDVVRLVAAGLTSKEIGERLGLSTKTVEGHRATVMEKLGVDSVAGLVKSAIRAGLADLDD
ncbi:response regulator transcription factor [Myxococcota bacterium]|nr:response regulator transcription factor [Myxococcota bacterium]